MAKTASNTPSRFDNLSDAALADALGRADAILKAAEAEVAALKAEVKARGLTIATGDEFEVSVTESISGRADTKALKEFLGAAYCKFEKAVISQTVRIKATNRITAIAA